VFSVVPTPQVYKWTGNNELFVLSNDKCFAMGGGAEGFAIQVTGGLLFIVLLLSDFCCFSFFFWLC
jgi:hypothetical protein